MARNRNTKITDLEVAIAVIAHEGVPCFCGNEQARLPQPKRLVSCTGGFFWGTAEEHWPTSADDQALIPWLQIVCTEMSELYGAFYNRKAVCFYIREDFTDYEAVSTFDGGDFVVREYGLDDDLVPLTRPKTLTSHPFRPVVWERVMDYPSISKYHGLFDQAVYQSLCEMEELELENRSGIKIGGWPTPIQRGQEYPGSCDLQIDTTENFAYGDSGIAYLSQYGGQWHVSFDSC